MTRLAVTRQLKSPKRQNMTISPETLTKIAYAVRVAIHNNKDDEKIGMAALEAFATYATLNDWDEFQERATS